MKMMGRVAVRIIGCALLLLAVAAYQPALADCQGASVYFGGLGGLTSVRVDVADPSATWATYMLQDTTINQGPVPIGTFAVDLGSVGGEPGTAAVFGDWGGGFGMSGCPLSLDVPPTGVIDDNLANEVFIFSDSKNGATILILKSVGNAFDFDSASATGGENARAIMKPHVLRASTSATCVNVEFSWDPAVINQDPGSASLAATLLRGYRILETRTGTTARTGEVADTDGSTTDTHALVCLAKGAQGDLSTLRVGADLQGNGLALGAASSPIQNSGLAVPGKGKGLLKAPGQQK